MLTATPCRRLHAVRPAAVPGLRAEIRAEHDGDTHNACDNWTTANNWNPNAAPANNGTAAIIFAYSPPYAVGQHQSGHPVAGV